MESLFLIGPGVTGRARQRVALRLGATRSGPSTTAGASSPRPRALWAKFLAGLLALAIVGAAAATALAESSPRAQYVASQKARQHRAASKHQGRKRKTMITRTFQSGDANGAEISIPAVGSVDDFGPADPYPSPIQVSGFKRARITDVNLTLHDFSHQVTADVDVLLVSPGGRNAFVMGDVGGSLDASGASNLTITLDDEAESPLPTAVDVALTSGAFQPFDQDDFDDFDGFPAPAPAASGAVALSTFDGINPNGQWRLFIFDDGSVDVGQVGGGWSLEITARSKAKGKGQHKRKHGRRH